ncbi:hypothetical protein [Microcoleus sp. B3-D7]|uniref:hypothetical protein n=1 Tax=Microcoleus sp. B3-D7 TaxID=2818659 RepID=UPI002FD6FE25
MNLTPEFDDTSQSEVPQAEIPQSYDGKPLELADFVCPRYMAETAEEAIDRGFVYQIVELKGTILTVQRVSDPRTQISASSDFFISLQEEEGDADSEDDDDIDKQRLNKNRLKLAALRMKLIRNRRTK